MTLTIFLQILVGGVVLGSIYALVAFGLSLVYGVVRILNFSHGTILVVSAIVASVLFSAFGWHPILITALLIPVVMIFGSAFYLVLLDPCFRRFSTVLMSVSVLVTVCALIILPVAY